MKVLDIDMEYRSAEHGAHVHSNDHVANLKSTNFSININLNTFFDNYVFQFATQFDYIKNNIINEDNIPILTTVEMTEA